MAMLNNQRVYIYIYDFISIDGWKKIGWTTKKNNHLSIFFTNNHHLSSYFYVTFLHDRDLWVPTEIF